MLAIARVENTKKIRRAVAWQALCEGIYEKARRKREKEDEKRRAARWEGRHICIRPEIIIIDSVHPERAESQRPKG